MIANKSQAANIVMSVALLATLSPTLVWADAATAIMTSPARRQGSGQLPRQMKLNILTDAARRSQTKRDVWQISKIQAMQWSFTGGGPSRPMTGTIPINTTFSGWKVMVRSPRQQWVYYATQEGFELDAPQSVPRSLVNEAISQVVRMTGRPTESLRVHWVEYQLWSDTCLGIIINHRSCPKSKKSVPGWRIQINSDGNYPAQLWTFHSGLHRDVRFQGSQAWQPPQ